MGGWGFILPFTNLFYVSLGLSGTQIGTISSLSAIVGLNLSPIVVTEIKAFLRPDHPSIFPGFWRHGVFPARTAAAIWLILIIIFFHAVLTSGIMPTSDAMAVAVSQKADTGYGSVRVWASVGWILTVLISGWLIERFGFGAGFAGVLSHVDHRRGTSAVHSGGLFCRAKGY